jgi:hypothetical protein
MVRGTARGCQPPSWLLEWNVNRVTSSTCCASEVRLDACTQMPLMRKQHNTAPNNTSETTCAHLLHPLRRCCCHCHDWHTRQSLPQHSKLSIGRPEAAAE